MLQGWGKVLIILSTFVCGCAGPTTPFGALNGFATHYGSEDAISDRAAAKSMTGDVKIDFRPTRQILHGPSNFSVKVFDAKGIPENFNLNLYYNNEDLTRSFTRNAEITFLNAERTLMQVTTPNLRLLPSRDHRVRVHYKRSKDDQEVVAKFKPPRCSAFRGPKSVKEIPIFPVERSWLKSINRYSDKQKVNPNFVAGLIAQESAFNPRAVSSARALGLTQVTSIGEAEIIKMHESWPRFPNIEKLSVRELNRQISKGNIHSGNEWRLNPDLSIRGGIEYVKFLTGYWKRPDKRALIHKHLHRTESNMTEIVLASYNSGAARVSQAIARKGKYWLNDSELKEAKKYVRRVTSYCDSFARGEYQ